jgi:hypothetical protein
MPDENEVLKNCVGRRNFRGKKTFLVLSSKASTLPDMKPVPFQTYVYWECSIKLEVGGFSIPVK